MPYRTEDLRREQRKGALVVAGGLEVRYKPSKDRDVTPWRAEGSRIRYRASECSLKDPNGGDWIPCLRHLLKF